MGKIKVLCLNDDNHSKCYVTRGSYYHNMADFAKECLLKPHTVEYEVREVYICDPSEKLAELTEDEFLYLFDDIPRTVDFMTSETVSVIPFFQDGKHLSLLLFLQYQ